VEQALVKETIQQARDLPAGEDDIPTLNGVLSNLEICAAKLTAAMFSAPGEETDQENTVSEEEANDAEMHRLMRSAMGVQRTKKV